jgi:hypothetical protein
VLPWADSLPTRTDIAKGKSPDPVPSWLDDVDDESAFATTDGGQGIADAPAATTDATDGVPAGTRRTEEAGDDETGATWHTSSARPASGTLAATRSAPGSGDAALDKPAPSDEAAAKAAEASGTADDALPAGGDASRKTAPADFDAGSDGDFVATADDADADDVGIDDVDADDNDTGMDDTHIDADAGEAADEDATESADAKVSSGAQEVTVVPGVPRYHDPNCILIRFMPADDVQRMSVPEAEEAGCTPCRACQPE